MRRGARLGRRRPPGSRLGRGRAAPRVGVPLAALRHARKGRQSRFAVPRTPAALRASAPRARLPHGQNASVRNGPVFPSSLASAPRARPPPRPQGGNGAGQCRVAAAAFCLARMRLKAAPARRMSGMAASQGTPSAPETTGMRRPNAHAARMRAGAPARARIQAGASAAASPVNLDTHRCISLARLFSLSGGCRVHTRCRVSSRTSCGW